MDLDDKIKRNLKYYKQVHEELKARKTKSALIHLRKNVAYLSGDLILGKLLFK